MTIPQPLPDYAPVSAGDRLSAVDILRGFALLGILLMNILTFGLPFAAYFNPTVMGGATGPNLWAFVAQYVLFDGKMRGIFSMMFGVGVLLMISRAEERGKAAGIADIHYRRTLWLMLFGMIHAFLIWWGDILYPYALLGLMLYPLRKFSPKALFIVAGVQVFFLTAAMVGIGFMQRSSHDDAQKVYALAAQGMKLNPGQKKIKEKWVETLKESYPPRDELQKEVDDYRAGYVPGLKRRVKEVVKWHSLPYYFPGNWDMLSMMLVGMAFLKLGVVTAARSPRFYARLAFYGYSLGLPVNALAAWLAVGQNFEPLTMPFITSTYQIGRVAVTFGHVAILMLIVKAGTLRWLTSRLAAVGQMAFSNYISHSILCSLIFYGYGFALMGQVERWQLYLFVVLIWTFNLVWSPIWLAHFHFGPLEWCWRSLTYWKRQPMRLDAFSPQSHEEHKEDKERICVPL